MSRLQMSPLGLGACSCDLMDGALDEIDGGQKDYSNSGGVSRLISTVALRIYP